MAAFTVDDLRDLLLRHAGVPPAAVPDDPAFDLESLAIGSVALLALQLELRMAHDLTVRQEDLPRLRTVGSFLAFVNGA